MRTKTQHLRTITSTKGYWDWLKDRPSATGAGPHESPLANPDVLSNERASGPWEDSHAEASRKLLEYVHGLVARNPRTFALRERQVYTLIYRRQYTEGEAARALGVTRRAVRSYHHRALAKLRRLAEADRG